MSTKTDARTFEKYNWNELAKEVVRPGVTRCGFGGDDVLLVMNWLEPGMKVNPHSHPFEQLVYIVKGTANFHIGEEVVTAGPGDVIRIPPDVMHYAEPTGTETVLNLDVFSPIRDDYRHLMDYQQKK
jgi:quercetin dioxygenase-like cupin family protein